MDPVEAEQRLPGVWELVYWHAKLPDGSIRSPFGRKPAGTLVYTSDGVVSVNMMHTGRSDLSVSDEMRATCRRVGLGRAPDDPDNPDLQEAKLRYFRIASAYQAYSGQWRIEDNLVVHSVELALFPEWIGTELIRRYDFEDEDLILSPVTNDLSPPLKLRWRRH
jgi:hypothetical protein